MKTKHSYIIILLLGLIALAINIAYFYFPNVIGDFKLIYTTDERLHIGLRDGDYIEIFWGHEYWKDMEGEYQPLIEKATNKQTSYKKDPLTKRNNEIVEIIENPDVRIETILTKTGDKDFKLRRKYEIKNPLLIEDLDISFMQILIGSTNYSYSKDTNILNLEKCHLIVNKTNETNIDFSYKDNLLTASQVINSNTRRDSKYTINLNFTINCEQE